MENIFKNLWEEFPYRGESTALDIGWTPRMDVSETAEHLEVKAELPGLEKNDLDISLEGDALVIKGEKKHEK
jgi:HSP20 family protein